MSFYWERGIKRNKSWELIGRFEIKIKLKKGERWKKKGGFEENNGIWRGGRRRFVWNGKSVGDDCNINFIYVIKTF